MRNLFKKKKDDRYENFLKVSEEYLRIREKIKEIESVSQIAAFKRMIDLFNHRYGQQAHDYSQRLKGFLEGIVTSRFI